MTPENLPIERYDDQLAEKVARLKTLMSPFAAPEPEVFRSPVDHYRMRAEFRIWHDADDMYHIMFDQQTKQRIRVDQFPAASELINRLMSALIAALKPEPILRHKLFQIDYLSTQSGKIIASLLYHRKLDDVWQQRAEQLRDELRAQGFDLQLIGRASKTKIMLDQDYVDEVLPVAGRDMIYRQVENSFTQPNAAMNVQMLEWALAVTAGSKGDLLELYCGNGNFAGAGAQFRARAGDRDRQTVGGGGAIQHRCQPYRQCADHPHGGGRFYPGDERGARIQPVEGHRSERLQLRDDFRRSTAQRAGR